MRPHWPLALCYAISGTGWCVGGELAHRYLVCRGVFADCSALSAVARSPRARSPVPI